MTGFFRRNVCSEAPILVMANSTVQDKRSESHVLAYALHATIHVNNRQSHYDNELVFIVEQQPHFILIALNNDELLKQSVRG